MKKTLLATALAVGLGGLAVTSPAEAGTYEVPVAADTYVSKSTASAKLGSAARLRVDGRKATRQHAFLKVTVPQVPAGEDLRSVELRLRPTTSSPTGVTVHRTNASWAEGSLSWRTKPAKRARLGSSDRLVAGTVEVIDLDVSEVTPGSVLGLRLETSAQRTLAFHSRESVKNAPAVRVVTGTGVADGAPPVPAPATPAPTAPAPTAPAPTTPAPTTPAPTTPAPTTPPATAPGVQAFPPASPIRTKLIGMSAPASLWSQRISEVGKNGVTARRVFANLTSSGGGQMNLIRTAIADGMMPVISYKVPNVQTMIDGGYDSWLAELRRQLTSLDADVTATFWHEPHGDMDPAQFRAASMKFFDAVDAPSVAVGPILNGWLLDRRVADFASYTDARLLDKWEFVAVDSYQSGEPTAPGSSMPARAIPLLATWMDSVGHPDKPLGLGEYNGFSAAAMAEAGETILSTPEMWFGLAWNSQGDSYAPLTGDRITAFQRTKADARAQR